MRLQVFSHGTTAHLSRHVQNLVVISPVEAKVISVDLDIVVVHENIL